MKIKSILAASIAVACLSGCDNASQSKASVAQQPQTESTEVQASTQNDAAADLLYINASQVIFKNRATSASMFGISEELAGQYYQDKMDDYSVEAEQKMRADLMTVAAKIAALNVGDDIQDKENQEVMLSLIDYYAGNKDFDIGYIDGWMGLSAFIVNQINGPLIDVPGNLQNQHQISNFKDAENYLTRMAQFDDMVGSISAKLAFDVAKNWIAPKVNLEGTLAYIDSFLSAAPEQHPMVINLETKLAKLSEVNSEQKSALVNKAKLIMKEVVYPAYKDIHQQITLILPKARTESGIWAQPNGAQFYQDAINKLGDSKLSAEQIHQVGLDEVKRISAEMDTILTAEGYAQGTAGERMAALNTEERFLYEDSDAGRAKLLGDLNTYIAEITAKMSPLFATKPEYQVEVRSFPVEVQEGAAGGMYNAPSLDGSKPGIYWINLKDMKANPSYGLKTLTYHEANPGHHWQVALNMEQDSLPFLRRIAPYNAYVEGWALYSEQVAYELGMYENDPFGNLGRLQAELFRAVRLVVDTGIHHKRWTREQAIEYMANVTGTAMSDVVSEIERYMVWPGQALGYKLGMLKINELRTVAKNSLGDKFDLSQFHDVVLLGGAVPMNVLENKVIAWIEQNKIR